MRRTDQRIVLGQHAAGREIQQPALMRALVAVDMHRTLRLHRDDGDFFIVNQQLDADRLSLDKRLRRY
ncbi:hypothetical protein GCM10027077_13380 [Arenimonas maotaiensis]